MAIRFSNSFINTVRPGAYASVRVRSTPTGIGAATGIIAIIGEAAAGPDFANDNLKENFFSPDQTAQIEAKYVSGPIIDAARILAAPSNDPGIVGGPNSIVVLKTNAGAKASALVDTDYGSLKDKLEGFQGNSLAYKNLESQSEIAPSVESEAVLALSNLGNTSEVFTVTTPAASLITSGQHFLFQAGNSGQRYYAWYNKAGAGGDPAVAGRVGVVIAIGATDTANQVATATQLAIDALATFNATVLTNVVTVTAQTAGEAEDAVNVDVASLVIAVTTQGGLIDASALNGLSFSLRRNGSAVTVVTLSATEANHDTAAELAAEIQAQITALGMTCSAVAPDRIKIEINADVANHRKGWGKSFELIDSTPGDLAALSLDAGLIVSAQESAIETNVVNQATNEEETFQAIGQVALNIGYLGTSATLSINSSGVLTATVVGGAGANLSVDTKSYPTIKALADFISTKVGYSASADASSNSRPASELDKVNAIGIATSTASLKPGRIKKSLANYKAAAATSRFTDFTATETEGLPAPVTTLQFLSGGLKGGTTSAKILEALTALEGLNVNFVVPLISRDAAADIADSLTDATSTYTIDAVNGAIKTHVLKMSAVKLKKNRSAFLSYKGTFAEAKQKAGDQASFRTTLSFQDVINSGTQYQPWYAASVAAGMQAAGFYKAIFNKITNITSVVDPSGFDSGSPGDLEEAIESSLLTLERTNAGVIFCSDQTTYGFDSNFVYNSTQAVYAADIIALDLASTLQTKFVGQSLADVDAGTVVSEIAAKMNIYKRLKLIAGSDDAPLGYRGVIVEIDGPVLSVKLEIKIATAIFFIPVEIEVSQVQSSASA